MLNGLLSQAEGLGVFALLGGALGLLVFFVSGLVFTQLSGGLTVRIAVAHAAGMFIRELLIQAHTFGGRRVAGKQTFQDRKSTRLNSSHVAISYAVFCLKKKK